MREGHLLPGRRDGAQLSRGGPAHVQRGPHHRDAQLRPSADLPAFVPGGRHTRSRRRHRVGRRRARRPESAVALLPHSWPWPLADGRRLSHRGILLLHDIHPATVMALPSLLNELKDKGYHVVQVVAAGERPQSLPDLVASPIHEEAWPRVLKTSATAAAPVHVKAALRHRIKKGGTQEKARPAGG